MANLDNTTFKCSNSEAVRAFSEATKGINSLGMVFNDGDTEFSTKTAWGPPHGVVQEISKRFPDDIITCRYSFEHNEWNEIHTVVYHNGTDKVISLEPNYSYSMSPLKNQKAVDGIFDRAVAFCRKLDIVEEKNGELCINWFWDKVCFNFEYDGEDGTKYRVTTLKHGSRIKFKIFESVLKRVWKEIEHTLDDNELPF